MIFCLYGPSCTAKTTLAPRVAQELNLPLRSCGGEVRQRAAALDMALADLPDEIHSEIDDATVVWGIGHQPCLIEGRFLDAVFAKRNAPIVLIKLTASLDQRCARWQNRQKIFTLTVEDLVRADTEDVRFRARMFHFREPAVPDLTVDTSELTVDACAQRVKTYIRARFVQPA
jgi:cytidylate kinase